MRTPVLVAAIALGAVFPAAAQTLKPGLWEIHNKMNNAQGGDAMAEMHKEMEEERALMKEIGGMRNEMEEMEKGIAQSNEEQMKKIREEAIPQMEAKIGEMKKRQSSVSRRFVIRPEGEINDLGKSIELAKGKVQKAIDDQKQQMEEEIIARIQTILTNSENELPNDEWC